MSMKAAITACASRSRLALAGLLAAALLTLGAGAPDARAAALKIAVGGSGCICYLPTILTQQLGSFEEAGVPDRTVGVARGAGRLPPHTGRGTPVGASFGVPTR